MNEPTPERLTVDEAAERLGVTRRTVARWCAKGLLPGAYKVGTHRRGVWVIPLRALEGFVPSSKRGHPGARNEKRP